jgi:bifunctional UDP-N-acetylglucosamine pyrophosphorylase/glucosamine-1-phosphate N-acetyltransferase
LRDVFVGSDVQIKPNSVIEEARIGAGCEIGPFARIRPATVLDENVHIGNFVELKKSEVGARSKINHLSYVGDSSVGADVNVGAGTITANYDGANKHRTVIEDDVSIGANSVLVAPVKVAKSATLGASTVLRKDAPAGELTLTVSQQKTIPDWKRPRKKPKG